MDWFSVLVMAGGAMFGGALGVGLAIALARLAPANVRLAITVACGALFAAGGAFGARYVYTLGEYSTATIEASLRGDPALVPLIDAWSQSDRASFDEFLASLATGADAGEGRERLIQRGRAAIVAATGPRLQLLDDATLVEFARVNIAELQALEQRRPQACHPMINNRPAGEIRPYISAQTAARERAVVIEAFRARPRARQTRLTPDQGRAAVQQVFAALDQRYGRDVLLMLPNASVQGNEERVCEVSAGFFEVIIDRPQAEAGPLMRFILSAR